MLFSFTLNEKSVSWRRAFQVTSLLLVIVGCEKASSQTSKHTIFFWLRSFNYTSGFNSEARGKKEKKGKKKRSCAGLSLLDSTSPPTGLTFKPSATSRLPPAASHTASCIVQAANSSRQPLLLIFQPLAACHGRKLQRGTACIHAPPWESGEKVVPYLSQYVICLTRLIGFHTVAS